MRIFYFCIYSLISINFIFAHALPHDVSDHSRFVLRLELNKSLDNALKFFEALPIPGLLSFMTLIKTTDREIFLEYDLKKNYSFWIKHNDENFEHEQDWVKNLSQIMGKPKILFIEGQKYWMFQNTPDFLLHYQTHRISLIPKKKSIQKKRKKTSFYWKENNTPIPHKNLNPNFPSISSWLDLSDKKHGRKNDKFLHLLITHLLPNLYSYQSLIIEKQGLKLSLNVPLEDSAKSHVEIFAPPPTCEWRFPQMFPQRPDVYFELAPTDSSTLLHQLRDIIYNWGEIPGKEFDQDLISFEEKYGFSLETDLLKIFSRGAAYTAFSPQHKDWNNTDLIWASTFLLDNKSFLINLLNHFPSETLISKEDKENSYYAIFKLNDETLFIKWIQRQTYISNNQALMNKMHDLSHSDSEKHFQLPKKVNTFHQKPSGFGHRLFFNKRYTAQLFQNKLIKELEQTKVISANYLAPYKDVITTWLTQKNYWSLCQLSYEGGMLQFNAWIDQSED
jgi:hypothetical protein